MITEGPEIITVHVPSRLVDKIERTFMQTLKRGMRYEELISFLKEDIISVYAGGCDGEGHDSLARALQVKFR